MLRNRYKTDPGLIERALYAFGLLEALIIAGLKFTFKGGTSMMLLLEHPVRLSTDIDIIVEPGTVVDEFIEKAGNIFPFLKKQEDIRRRKSSLEKRHFKFVYYSPVRQTEFYILLDIVFMNTPYEQTVMKKVKNDLLITDSEELMVAVPTPECILGDKLAAFAPHTTGVLLGTYKELEIAKQFFDVSVLSEQMKDQKQFKNTYRNAVREELDFRGLQMDLEDVLNDTIRACKCIISRGEYDREDYVEYLKGIRSLSDHIIGRKFNPEIAAEKACSVLCLAASILAEEDYPKIIKPDMYEKSRLSCGQFRRLAYIRKRNPAAYGYLVEADRMLKPYIDNHPA